MSYVLVAPKMVADAAGNLTGIGSAISEANSAAAASTTQVLPVASDEVSRAISGLFGGYAQEYQALSAQAAGFHAQFVQALTAGAGSYASAEAANAAAFTANPAARSRPRNAIPRWTTTRSAPRRHAPGEEWDCDPWYLAGVR